MDASLLICEMFAYYKAQGVSLLDRLNALYAQYGYCLNTLHSYTFEGAAGFDRMQAIMQAFRGDIAAFGGKAVQAYQDYLHGLDGLPPSDVIKFHLADHCSVRCAPLRHRAQAEGLHLRQRGKPSCRLRRQSGRLPPIWKS